MKPLLILYEEYDLSAAWLADRLRARGRAVCALTAAAPFSSESRSQPPVDQGSAVRESQLSQSSSGDRSCAQFSSSFGSTRTTARCVFFEEHLLPLSTFRASQT